MVHLLPPYTKNHIIILGSITLLASFLLLFILAPKSQPEDRLKAEVVAATPKSLKESFKEPLKVVQQGNFDTAWANDGFLIIDIRNTEDYNQAHIAGALSAPLAQLQYAVFSPETKLVVYSPSAEDLKKSVAILEEMGVKKIYTLNQSMDDLEKDGYIITKQ